LLPSNTTIPWYVHITPWFGKSGHVNIGVNCNTVAWVQNFVEDAVRRGFNGCSIDWYGHGSFENQVTLKLQDYLRTRTDNQFKFCICFDKGITGLSESVLRDEIAYCQSQYFNDANYITVGTKPLLQFFGVANAIGDTAMANVKAATTGSSAFWQLQVSKISKSYVDGIFDWTHNWHNGVDSGDPYNINGLDSYFTNITSQPSKPCFAAPCAGFNGYLTDSVGWSKGKYLPRGDGECWISYCQEIDTQLTSQIVGIMVPTWNDWEEGSSIEGGIENDITVTAAIASPPTLTWSASGGTGDEQTINSYVVWARTYTGSDSDPLKYLATVATGVGTYDLSTAVGLTPGSTYKIYVEAMGQPCIRNKMSNGIDYTA
jgi:hypothetical protein